MRADVLKEDICGKWGLSTLWRRFCECLSICSKWLNSLLWRYNTWRINTYNTTRAAAEQTGDMEGISSKIYIMCVCSYLCRVRNQWWERGLQARIPAPDHMWGTRGNHPAQQQLTHERFDHSTPSLSHLSASHVGRPPRPNSVLYIKKEKQDTKTQDRTGKQGAKKRVECDGGQLWVPHPVTPHSGG